MNKLLESMKKAIQQLEKQNAISNGQLKILTLYRYDVININDFDRWFKETYG